MKFYILFISVLLSCLFFKATGQTITYSQIEKADHRNLNFEILGKFSDNFLVYKNSGKRHEITIYDNNMSVIQNVKLDFISDRTTNIDFITYPDHFLMVWQFDKGNVTRCRAANMTPAGQLIGAVKELDSTRSGFFAAKSSYTLTWSEDKKKILLYKIQPKNDVFDLETKTFDDNMLLLDSSKKLIDYNDRKEYFTDLQISNEGTYVFSKVKHNARIEYISSLEVFSRKLRSDSLLSVKIPLRDQLIQEPFLKIDNTYNRLLVNSFSYRKTAGYVDGIMTAVLSMQPFVMKNSTINLFHDSLLTKLSRRTDWRTAYDNLNLRNIIMKKDGGFIAVSEQYYKQRRFGNTFDDRFSPGAGNYRYSSASDYYLYNRGYSGYYRPFNDNYGRDIIYHYNDIISFSISKDLRLQWNNVINKTTSNTETDNFLSFANMNAGGEIHFLFLQKDNNRQIISDHALQPDGSVKRYATLKGRESGFYFMPRLSRQTGLRQMIIPCIVRSNIAFAKIDF